MAGERLLTLSLQRILLEESNLSVEREMLEVARSLEAGRKRWLKAELELKQYKELLVKSDVSKAGLEVKLKHARNQLDVEMKKRFKVENDFQYLQRQMQLMCDILIHDSRSNSFLNDEQKSLIATFDHRGGGATLHRTNKRLSVINQSSFLSDISYDHTDDDVDLDTTVIKPLRSRVREKRRSSLGPNGSTGSAAVVKRARSVNVSAEQLLDKISEEKEVETNAKAPVVTSEDGEKNQEEDPAEGAVPAAEGAVPAAEGAVPTAEGAVPATEGEGAVPAADQTSVWIHNDETLMEPKAPTPQDDQSAARPKKVQHVFLSKTVIRTETCQPCGKRIRFGKAVVKCRNCRVVSHPECKQKVSDGCSAPATGRNARMEQLQGLSPLSRPHIPQLIVDCVAEIERRGLQERGLYRVPGSERLIRELSERVVQGKPSPCLSKVQDVHVLCGLLKDFLRHLKEPLLTFKLHRVFMDASELPDEEGSLSIFYQAISQLPKTNRDTLAFIILHLHKVSRSPDCHMDRRNLSRVFGPTLVGHGLSQPSPSTIMNDTFTQPKVVARLLSIPEDFWRRVLQSESFPSPDGERARDVEGVRGGQNQGVASARLFQPLTSQERRNYRNAYTAAGLGGPVRRFFTSPKAEN